MPDQRTNRDDPSQFWWAVLDLRSPAWPLQPAVYWQKNQYAAGAPYATSTKVEWDFCDVGWDTSPTEHFPPGYRRPADQNTPVAVRLDGVAAEARPPSDPDDEPRPWRWRNLRSFTISAYFSPLPWDWHLAAKAVDIDEGSGGFTGRFYAIAVGPFIFHFEVDIGNCSVPGWRGRFGLSETEAWERSKP